MIGYDIRCCLILLNRWCICNTIVQAIVVPGILMWPLNELFNALYHLALVQMQNNVPERFEKLYICIMVYMKPFFHGVPHCHIISDSWNYLNTVCVSCEYEVD